MIDQGFQTRVGQESKVDERIILLKYRKRLDNMSSVIVIYR